VIYTIAALFGDPMLCQNLADHGTRPASRPCPTIPERLHCRLRLEFVHGRRRQNETPSWAAGAVRDGKDMERMKKTAQRRWFGVSVYWSVAGKAKWKSWF